MTANSPSERAWLQAQIEAFGGVAGTVHRRAGLHLTLSAAMNIPRPVVARVQTIPRGKGMAGLALERAAPVQTCDLQTDETGDVQPGAKAVDAGAAVAVPVFDDRGQVRAVVGIAFADPRLIEPTVVEAIQAAAQTLTA